MSSETTSTETSSDITNFKSNSEWTKFSGSNLDDWASRITTGVDGSIYQLGFTDGSFDNENNNGKTDFFIIHLPWSYQYECLCKQTSLFLSENPELILRRNTTKASVFIILWLGLKYT